MFEKLENYYHLVNSKIATVQSPAKEGKIAGTSFKKECTVFSAKLLWELFSTDDSVRQLYPNLFFLLYMLNIFPLNAACVERLFSRMKLIKTRLRNQLSQVRLDQLLRISTESPKDDYNDNVYEYFVDELQKKKKNKHAHRTLVFEFCHSLKGRMLYLLL